MVNRLRKGFNFISEPCDLFGKSHIRFLSEPLNFMAKELSKSLLLALTERSALLKS